MAWSPSLSGSMTFLAAEDVRNIEDPFFNLLVAAPGTKEKKQAFFLSEMKIFVPRSNYEVMWERLVDEKGPALAGEAVIDYVLHSATPRLKELLEDARVDEEVALRSREPSVVGVLFFQNGNLRRIGEHLVDYMDEVNWVWPTTVVQVPTANSEPAGYEFDVALSLAGEDRPYVERVAAELRNLGIRPFYDEYEETAMWGKDLAVYLQEVIRDRAQYFVMFLSEHYAKKAWPSYEGHIALGRAIEEREEYILPVRFDNTPFPGLPSTIKYLDARKLTAKQLAKRIARKLKKG